MHCGQLHHAEQRVTMSKHNPVTVDMCKGLYKLNDQAVMSNTVKVE